MKRFTSLLITVISVFALETYAQTAAGVHAGQMVRQSMKEAWADLEPIGEDEQGVYYLALPYSAVMSGPVADGDYYLFLVNDQAELIKKTPIDFMVDGRRTEYEFTREMNGKVIVFASLENKKGRSVAFYAFDIDKKDFRVSKGRKVIELSFADLKKDYERASFKSEVSRDKSKMLISYSLIDDENMMLTFGYVVVDASMKELFKWSGGLDMSDGVYLFDQFRISNKAEVYLQTRYFPNEKAHDKNVSMKKTNFLSTTRSMEYQKNFEYRIVKFENKTTKIIPIHNKQRFYDALDMQVTSDGNLVLIGFYSPLEEDMMPVGAVALKVNTKTGAIQESTKEFGNAYEMPSNITIKNNGLAAGKDQYLKYRFLLSDIQFNKDGGYTLIGERNVTQTKRTQTSYYTVNHLDDLAVVDVSAAGAIAGVHRVEKSQQAEGLEIFNASYFYTEHNKNRYIAFANLGKFSTEESVLVTLAPDGKQTREVMFTTKDAEIRLRPKECHLHNGKIVMYGNKNNRYCRWISKTL